MYSWKIFISFGERRLNNLAFKNNPLIIDEWYGKAINGFLSHLRVEKIPTGMSLVEKIVAVWSTQTDWKSGKVFPKCSFCDYSFQNIDC